MLAGRVTQNLQRGVVRQVRAEPKKAAALALLLALMGMMWAKVLVSESGHGAGLPGRASASERHRRGGGGGAEGVGGRAGAWSDTRNGARFGGGASSRDAAASLREWADGPINDAHRNLFLVKLEYFAKEASGEAPRSRESGQGFWDELAKSLTVKADQEKARRILIGNLQAQASKLNLQSTVMSGGSTKAMVNGTLVEEGDTVGGFKILKIEARRMVVEREGIRLEVYFN
jgi:hypothetical protein